MATIVGPSDAFVQPLGRKGVRNQKSADNFDRSVANPVPFSTIGKFLSKSQVEVLKRRFPVGGVPIWGIRPGKTGSMAKRFLEVKPGCWVFVVGDDEMYLAGAVALSWRSTSFAMHLWGDDGAGQTWECMYALYSLRAFDVPLSEFMHDLGWGGGHVQEFKRIKDGLVKVQRYSPYFVEE